MYIAPAAGQAAVQVSRRGRQAGIIGVVRLHVGAQFRQAVQLIREVGARVLPELVGQHHRAGLRVGIGNEQSYTW